MTLADSYVKELAQKAKKASYGLSGSSNEERSQALRGLAQVVRSHAEALEELNLEEVALAKEKGANAAFLDRLTLTSQRLEQMAVGMEQVADLPDPIGEVMARWTRPNGLVITQERVPLGVVGFIYESRATVTCDAVALCLKSGNAVVLRGGSESLKVNTFLIERFKEYLSQTSLGAEVIQFLHAGKREDVASLCACEGLVDVLIPRGGKGLVRVVMDHARMPVLKHLDGVCHLYVDKKASLPMALDLCDDGKTQRPGVCNALETLLVHEDCAEAFLPLLAARMSLRGVELRGDCRSLPGLGQGAILATEEDWRTEYEDLILSVKVVSSFSEAVEHINSYGSHHSDCIVTDDALRAQRFLAQVDSACVYHNCSTRFSDGFEFGFGAEIGIGTDKIHARGPMGLKELTSYKYKITGAGQVKDAQRLSKG